MNKKYFNYYIDDTGTKEIQDTTRPLFAYVGLMIEQSNEKFVVDNINAVKSKCFNTTEVEIKSTWLRIPEKRKEKYLDPYQISNDELNNFTEELYNSLIKLPLHCIGSVVDKNGLKSQYKLPFNPSPVCYDLLLQHVANYLTQYHGDSVFIYFDDMSGKNLAGSSWKKLLQRQHQQLKKGKSPFYKNWKTRTGMDYSRICDEITFIDSAISVLVQLADLCAYNVMRQARDHWGSCDEPPYYSYYERIIPIMHCDPDSGMILSYGIVNFP